MTCFALLMTACLGADANTTSPTDGPFLSIEYRVVETATDKPVEALKKGQKYDLLVTLRADQRKGVKLNQLFKTQSLRLGLLEGDPGSGKAKSIPKKQNINQQRNALSARVDAKTGAAKFLFGLTKDSTVDGTNVWLKLRADIVLCDERNTWCAKIREEAVMPLAPGKVSLKSLSLGFGAPAKNRVVLKVGDEAPQFVAPNVEDKSVSLADYRDKKYVVLLFSRAHW